MIESELGYCDKCTDSLRNRVDSLSTIKSATENENISGIGGWLIVVALQVIIYMFSYSFLFYESVIMLTDGSVDRFADQNSQYYNPSYYMILKYIAIYEIILLAASLYMTYLFFLKSRMFPNLYIIIQIAAIAFWVVEYVLIDSVAYVDEMREYITEMLQDEIKYIRTSIMSVIIWVSYMLKSKRVKATFIE